MKLWRRQRWIFLAAMTAGTVLQISTCREELSLFALRTAFTSVTLPINTLIQQTLLGI
jgi:hypothetical protein